MRPGQLAALFVLLASMPSHGQVLPEGATPEQVVTALGPPRSRTAARDREIWLYPDFQVTFEHGRLRGLTRTPAEGGVVEWSSAPLAAIPAPALQLSPGEDHAASSLRTGASAAPMVTVKDNGRILLRSPTRAVGRTTPDSGTGALAWYLGGMLGLLLAGGAGVWRWRRRRRSLAGAASEPATSVRQSGSRALSPASDEPSESGKPPSLADWELPLDVLQALEWKRFETLVQRYYVASGFRVTVAGTGADDGRDLFLYRAGGQRPFCGVWCLGRAGETVDLAAVRTFFEHLSARGVGEGVIVSRGAVEPDAAAFAVQNRLQLLTGRVWVQRFNQLPPMARERILREITQGDYTTPSCPRCQARLVRGETRTVEPTWRCTRFPHCRYTLGPAATAAGVGAAG